MSATGFNDANFYELVHQLVGPRDDIPVNRRNSHRHGFRGTQRIAPCSDGQPPPESAYCEVACQDLSTGGVSFLCRQPPAAAQLAVHLANDTIALWLLAEVCHTSEVPDGKGPLYLVGCRFVGRLELPRK